MHIIELFDRGARHNPDRPFLVSGDRVRTYAQSQVASHRVANALNAAGFEAGMKMAIFTPNDDRAFECLLGGFRAGGVWVVLNDRSTEAEARHILGHTEVAVLFYHSGHGEVVARLKTVLPCLRICICVDSPGAGDPFVDDWIKDMPAQAPRLALGKDDLYGIYSTGGTTGMPKGVVQTNLVTQTKVSTILVHMPPKQRPVNLVAAPMTHSAGSIMQALMGLGATNIILEKFDALQVMQAIERHRVTYLFLPPTAIYMMLAHPQVRNFDYSSLEYFIYAAAPMSVDKLKEAIDTFGPVMAQTYGQVESPLICTYFSPADHVEALQAGDETRLASCGRASMFTSVGIMDDDGNILPNEQTGEIVVRGNMLLKEYYNNPEATRASRTSDGWHRTGDIGIEDGQGYIRIIDRKKDMIISGGYNLYPSEIEQVLWSHPAVQDCAVIGIPHAIWGEAVHAVIELKPGAQATETELLQYCKAELGSIKCPKSVEIVSELPRSPVGKVLKRALRESYWSGQSRKIG